jgi:hypothetical protein
MPAEDAVSGQLKAGDLVTFKITVTRGWHRIAEDRPARVVEVFDDNTVEVVYQHEGYERKSRFQRSSVTLVPSS